MPAQLKVIRDDKAKDKSVKAQEMTEGLNYLTFL